MAIAAPSFKLEPSLAQDAGSYQLGFTPAQSTRLAAPTPGDRLSDIDLKALIPQIGTTIGSGLVGFAGKLAVQSSFLTQNLGKTAARQLLSSRNLLGIHQALTAKQRLVATTVSALLFYGATRAYQWAAHGQGWQGVGAEAENLAWFGGMFLGGDLILGKVLKVSANPLIHLLAEYGFFSFYEGFEGAGRTAKQQLAQGKFNGDEILQAAHHAFSPRALVERGLFIGGLRIGKKLTQPLETRIFDTVTSLKPQTQNLLANASKPAATAAAVTGLAAIDPQLALMSASAVGMAWFGKKAKTPSAPPEGLQSTVKSGSRYFREQLAEVVAKEPRVFKGVIVDPKGGPKRDVTIPKGGKAFKKGYDQALAEFQAALATAEFPQFALARLLNYHQDQVFVRRKGQEMSLDTAMGLPVQPLAMEMMGASASSSRFRPVIRTRDAQGQEVILKTRSALTEFAQEWANKGWMTYEAAAKIEWVAKNIIGGPERSRSDVGFNLSTIGPVVVHGGTAEYSPLRALLAGGAKVFVTGRDSAKTRAIAKQMQESGTLAGSLHYATNGSNLLTQTPEIARTIERFAGGKPVHFLNIPYAAGRGREIRLPIACEASGRFVETASQGVYLSPTLPHHVPIDHAASAKAGYTRRGWGAKLTSALSGGKLHTSSLVTAEGHQGKASVVQATVPIQGPSYAAGKMYDVWRAMQAALDGQVFSANVMPAARTASVEQNLAFKLAYDGAAKKGIHIPSAETARDVAAILYMHDLVRAVPAAHGQQSGNGSASVLIPSMVHGGMLSSPFATNSVLPIAAMHGAVRAITPSFGTKT